MEETFYSTTGLESEAGAMLWDNLEPRDLRRLLKYVNKFGQELNKCESELAQRLLYKHFKDLQNEPFMSHKQNVICAVWKTRRIDPDQRPRSKREGGMHYERSNA